MPYQRQCLAGCRKRPRQLALGVTDPLACSGSQRWVVFQQEERIGDPLQRVLDLMDYAGRNQAQLRKSLMIAAFLVARNTRHDSSDTLYNLQGQAGMSGF